MRRLFLGVLVFAISYALLEAISWAAYKATYKQPFSFAELTAQRAQVLASPGTVLDPEHVLAMPANAREALHPYTGFVLDPDKENRLDVNKYGFVGPVPPIGPDKDENEFTVILLGGSVAVGLYNDAARLLVDNIKSSPALAGRNVRLYSLALPGMKQPQQLMALMYMLSLGAEPDIVINLDGFNDAVLPVDESTLQNLNPFYPRSWSLRMGGGLTDPELLKKAGRIAYREQLRIWLAEAAGIAPLRWSITVNLIWRLADSRLERSIETSRYYLISNLRDAGAVSEHYDRRFSTHGPPFEYLDDDAMYQDVVRFWVRSSMLMQDLARGNGFEYFHFLQPNQYVADSKPMSAVEKQIALMTDHPYSQPAARGYEYLMQYGKEYLQNEDDFYTDLTRIFENDHRIVYSDNCCHFNIAGNHVIARAIGDRVLERLAGQNE